MPSISTAGSTSRCRTRRGTGEQVELQSNASRIGVKGDKDLGSGLKVVYQLEWGINIDSQSNDDDVVPRNQFVGLEGAFGTIKVGRHDTALKQAQSGFDLFDDLEGDIGKVFNGENRLKDYIGYVTPVFGKAFSATVNFFPGEDPDAGNDGVADKTRCPSSMRRNSWWCPRRTIATSMARVSRQTAWSAVTPSGLRGSCSSISRQIQVC